MNSNCARPCASVWIGLILTLLLTQAPIAAAGVKPGEPAWSTKAFVAGAGKLVAGSQHNCAVAAGGSVQCWGYNEFGQLGDGSHSNRSTPVTVSGISNAIAVAAGDRHSCAVVAGGAVLCWGENRFGQLGDGTTTSRLTPVAVIGVAGASALASGSYHTCALIAGGAIRCWGNNGFGQLGDGSTVNRLTAVAVAAVDGAVALAAGSTHTCAIVAAGAMRCWGDNQFGQLGDGSTSARLTAVSVSGVTGATALAAGNFGTHTCAVVAAGALRCWGSNGFGQLGDGTTTTRLTPVAVSAISGAVKLSAGQYHSCAQIAGGAVKCWGFNTFGQLGDGTTSDRLTPVAVTGVAGAIDLTAGTFHTCALVAGGAVPCWGANNSGQLGNGTAQYQPTAVPVSGVTAASAVVAGGGHSCALLSAGAVQCWGANFEGQLGNGSTTSSVTAVSVAGISGATALAAGDRHACAIVTGGAVRCWGQNVFGQLGDGSTSTRLSPVAVSGVSGAIALAAGERHTCALLATGAITCWGDNGSGQLGDGSTSRRLTAVTTSGISGAVRVAAGAAHSCAVISGGAVRCWGNNDFGQLGDGSTTRRLTPVAVSGVAAASALSAPSFGNFSCAVSVGGNLQCWGRNFYGQLGDGSTTDRPTPVTATAISGAIAVATGSGHTCALLSGGTVLCRGFNFYGQLGDGSTSDRLAPVAVSGVATASAIAAGYTHSCALLTSGALRCWGDGFYGQLGDGTLGYATSAVDLQSRSSAGAVANAASGKSVVSRSGSKIGFASDANNLADDPNNRRDVFIRDPATRVTTRISTVAESINGGALEAFDDPAISDDGSRIAFSGSSGQIYAAVNGLGRVLSSSATGVLGNGPSARVNLPGIGNLALFESQATNLLAAADGNGSVSDIFVKDLTSGTVTLVSRGANGEPANGDSISPWASADGQTIVFSTRATNLVPTGAASLNHGKASPFHQAIVIRTGSFGQSGFYVSRNLLTGEAGNGDSINVRLTPDRRYGVFESRASNLVAGDSNNASDIFRFELSGNTLVALIPVSTSTLGFGNGDSRHPSISDDGLSVTFETTATNLIATDRNNVSDVLVKSMLTGELVRMAPTIDGLEPNGASTEPEISHDGAVVTFTSSATNLVPNDNNSVPDVYSVELNAPPVPVATGPLDEPSVTSFALPAPNPANVNCPSGFFSATVDDGPGAGLTAGAFGMEVLLDEPGTRVLAGGLNFGGLIDISQVGFAGFTIANAANEPQRLHLSLTGSPATSSTASLPVRIRITRRTATTSDTVFETTQTISLANPYVTSIDLPPAFYAATVAPITGVAGGTPEGQFYFSLTTSFVDRPGGGFQGGAVVGGYHATHPFGGVSGFAAFCLATPHSTSIRVLSQPSYGPTGAKDLRLRIQDAQQRDLVVVPTG